MDIEKIVISKINHSDIESVQHFLRDHLKEFFAYDGQTAITNDVWNLAKRYIEPERNQMWAAFSPEGTPIGTIAICEYNDRITVLKGRYHSVVTAEIGRCYIDKTLRRRGIGSKMLELAEAFCREQGYKMIYLHTHHFLPGGFHFWQKQGFQITLDEGGAEEIVHMEKEITI